MLTPTDRTILAIESQRWKYPGAKEATVRERLDMSPTRYYQRLNALLDDPEAEAAHPHLTHRLRRLRDTPTPTPQTPNHPPHRVSDETGGRVEH